MSDLKKRILLVLEKEGVTANSAASTIGIRPTALYNIIKGKSKPSYDVLKSISDRYNISLNWLILGVGEMKLERSSFVTANESTQVNEAQEKNWRLEFSKAIQLNNPVKNGADLLFDFHIYILPRIIERHRLFFENPYNRMLKDVSNGIEPKVIIENNYKSINVMREYSKLVNPFVSTMNSYHEHQLYKDLTEYMSE